MNSRIADFAPCVNLKTICSADVRIEMPRTSRYEKYKKGFWRKHLEYSTRIVMIVFGVPVFKQLYHIFFTELKRTCSSREELLVTLRSK